MRRTIIILIGLLVLTFFSCDDSESISLSREDLFTLNLGKMENQFDYFFNPHSSQDTRNDVFFDDGIFFIVNGNAGKVMEFSLFGELTLLLYQPDKNPAPVVLPRGEPAAGSFDIISRRAVPAALNELGAFGVDRSKNIYVADRPAAAAVPEGDPGADANSGGAAFRHVIRRFDRLGNTMDTIGRTGRNGLPFPAIEDFYLTNNDHLVVVCRTNEGCTVYWLNDRSRLLYEVQFDYLRLPVPKDSDLIPTLGKIVPDYRERKLYIMISYFSNVKDESTRLVSRVSHIESRIFTFNLETEQYETRFVTIPAETGQTGDPLFSQESQRVPLPYIFLGVSAQNRFFLLKSKNKTTYELLALDADGRTRKRMRMFIDDTGMVSAEFHISKDGLLYALIAENTCARVVRWRSDQAVSGGR